MRAPLARARAVGWPSPLWGGAASVAALTTWTWRGGFFGRGGQAGRPGGGSAAVVGAGTVVVRQVLLPGDYRWLGRPSLDGRLFSFVNAEGNLALKEIATGIVRALTARGQSAEGAVVESAISPDAKAIAYSWATLDGAVELRVADIDGSWPRVLVRRTDVDVPHVIEWSRDGASLLAQLEMKDGTYQLALVNVVDGTVRRLKDLGTDRSLKSSLSNDARFIAYDRPQQADRPMRDVFVLDVDGGREWPLVADPASDLYPQWSPDGTQVVFASDRTGALGLWSVRVADGRAVAEPQVVSRDVGRMNPLGFTHDGTLFFHLQTGLVDVYTASVDPSTGLVAGRSEPVAPNYIGSNISSDWSADGRRLAYVSIKSPAGSDRFSRTLTIRDIESGQARTLWPALAFFMGPRWSPDGRRILVGGMGLDGRSGVHEVDVESGVVRPALVQSRVPDGEAIGQHTFSRDGRAILFVRRATQIVSHDLATGVEAVLLDLSSLGVDRFVPGGNGNPTFEVSPDGRAIAFSGWIGSGPAARSVLDVVTGGGPALELMRAAEPLTFQGWTPDGLDLLVVRPTAKDSDAQALWRVPVNGGPPRAMGLEMAGLRDVHVSADGRRLTFTAGWQTGDVRTMENVLSK